MMSLQEAIEEAKHQSDDVFGKFTEWDLERITRCDEDEDAILTTAIATILNAVVKGELK